MLYKDHDLRRAINLPGARFEGQLSEWFSITAVYFDLNPKIIIPVGLVLIVLPLILIFYIKPCDLQDLCSECGKNPFYVRTDIREHLRSAPRQMVSVAKPFFTGGCVMALFEKTKILNAQHWLQCLLSATFEFSQVNSKNAYLAKYIGVPSTFSALNFVLYS